MKHTFSLVSGLLGVYFFLNANVVFADYLYTFILPSAVVSSPSTTPTTTPTTTGGGLYRLGGCNDPKAKNFDSWVTYNNGSCVYDQVPVPPVTPTPVAPCVPYFTQYQRQGDSGPEVLKIKKFLNEKEGENLVLDDKYDLTLTKAIMRFQMTYSARTLIPWSLTFPTGRWYQSTQKKANDILGCSGPIRLDNGVTID